MGDRHTAQNVRSRPGHAGHTTTAGCAADCGVEDTTPDLQRPNTPGHLVGRRDVRRLVVDRDVDGCNLAVTYGDEDRNLIEGQGSCVAY